MAWPVPVICFLILVENEIKVLFDIFCLHVLHKHLSQSAEVVLALVGEHVQECDRSYGLGGGERRGEGKGGEREGKEGEGREREEIEEGRREKGRRLRREGGRKGGD